MGQFSLPFRVKLLWFRPQVPSVMYVVCWYAHANTFLELDTTDLTVLVAAPEKAAGSVGILQAVSDSTAPSTHRDGHHLCSSWAWD